MSVSAFKSFAMKCEAAGLKARECSPYHWQVLGGKHLVNYFHGKKGPYCHIDKTNNGIRGSDELAIKYANDLPKISLIGRKHQGYLKYKKRLYKKSNICALCQLQMEFEEASVDHIIPLSRGGMNNPNNYQLAHIKCNEKKGNSV